MTIDTNKDVITVKMVKKIKKSGQKKQKKLSKKDAKELTNALKLVAVSVIVDRMFNKFK